MATRLPENISSYEIVLKIFQWKKIFMRITIISFVFGLILIFLIPKQYLSVAILFPSRNFSAAKLVVEANAGNQEDYLNLGYSDDLERLMQSLKTDALKLEVADHLNLWDKWKIEKDEYKYHNLKKKWKNMVKY